MKRTRKEFRRFLIDEPTDMTDYNRIVADPLCHITNEDIQVEEDKIFDEEGKLSKITKRTTYLVHWEEKVI